MKIKQNSSFPSIYFPFLGVSNFPAIFFFMCKYCNFYVNENNPDLQVEKELDFFFMSFVDKLQFSHRAIWNYGLFTCEKLLSDACPGLF